MPLRDRLSSTLRRRAGGLVLPVVLLAGLLAATMGAGYSATQTQLGDAIAHLMRGHSLTQVNPESRRVEAEARTPATGTQDVETAPLPGGDVAITNKDTGETQVYDTGTMRPENSPIKAPVVLGSGDSAYVLDPAGDTVRLLDDEGRAVSETKVPGASGTAAPDGGNGIWVLHDDGKLTHIVRDKVHEPISLRDRVTALTVADGRPVAITAAGAALDIAADPPSQIHQQPVPGDEGVLPASRKGPGRYLVVLDPKGNRLVSLDPRTRERREFTDLPKGEGHRLGAPVVLDDRVFVPDFATPHKLYVRDLATGERLPDVEVPGEHNTFELAVRNNRVWANDQFDQQSVTIGADGSKQYIDKGPGEGVRTNTNEKNKKKDPATQQPKPTPPVQIPLPAPPTSTAPLKPTTPPPPTVTTTARPKPKPPEVRNMRTAEGCQVITANALDCARQPDPAPAPTWERLDVITSQNPPAGSEVDLGSTVTVRYYDHVLIERVVDHDATGVCNMITTESRGLVTCRAVQGNGTGRPGTVESQSPAAGSPVRIGSTVTLTYYPTPAPPPTVPGPFEGQDVNQACAEIQSRGYTCRPLADRVARTANTVTDQSPPAGTPQQGGFVDVHYSPYVAQELIRMRHPTDPKVRIIRINGIDVPPDYIREKSLGWAYQPQGVAPPGYRQIWGFQCVTTESACDGHKPNHYYSAAENPVNGNWQRTRVITWTIAPAGACPAGQVMISRLGRFANGNREYTVEHWPSATPPAGWEYAEPLGCVWSS